MKEKIAIALMVLCLLIGLISCTSNKVVRPSSVDPIIEGKARIKIINCNSVVYAGLYNIDKDLEEVDTSLKGVGNKIHEVDPGNYRIFKHYPALNYSTGVADISVKAGDSREVWIDCY